MALNFRNILDIYGIYNTGDPELNKFTVAENAQLFLNIFGIDTDGDGEADTIRLSDYKAAIASLGISENAANNLYSAYDSNEDGVLSEAEIINGLGSLDSSGNNDGFIDFDEALGFYNTSAEVDLNQSKTNFTQYVSFFKAAKDMMKYIDKNADQKITDEEYSAYLINSGLAGRYGGDFVDLFDGLGNEDGVIDFEEVINAFIAWDDNQDGSIDYTNSDSLLAEGEDYYNLYMEARPTQVDYYRPSEFANILNIFNIGIYGQDGDKPFTIKENANALMDLVDEDGDGYIAEDEFNDFLTDLGLADNDLSGFYSTYDSGSNGLDTSELENILNSFESNTDGNSTIDFEEGLNFFKAITGISEIPSIEDAEDPVGYFLDHLSAAQSLLTNYDSDGDGLLDSSDVSKIIEAIGIPDSYVNDFIELFDNDSDLNVSLGEYLNKLMEWDLDKDGVVELYDSDNPEGADYFNFLPDIYKTYDTGTIEHTAQQLLTSVDQDGDLKISEEEYAEYVSKNFALSSSMGQELIKNYDTDEDGYIGFDELVAAYNSFDTATLEEDGTETHGTGGDGILSYSELVNFQNTLTDMDIDPLVITQEQYTNLYNLSVSVTKAMDDDFDGEITVEEYRAYIKSLYQGSDAEVPLYAAENFIQTFDMDKDGTVNTMELIRIYSEYDTDPDGTLTSNEISDLQAKLDDRTLYDTVNSEIMDAADKNKNSKLTLDEYKDFLAENGMPEDLAYSAFAMFDINEDGNLSRLELMEAFARYDNNVDNLEFIEDLTGTSYVLYEGNNDNKLDADEKLKMYEDLANADYDPNYNVDSSKINQYEAITEDMENFIESLDFNENGVIDANEYKNYLKELGLPAYIAENAVNNSFTNFDLNDDDVLDIIEWTQIALDYDTNNNGILEFEEEFAIYEDMSGVNLGLDSLNAEHYARVNNSVSELIEKYDLDGNNILDKSEIANFFVDEGMTADAVEKALEKYDTAFDTTIADSDNALDALELMKMYHDFDSDKDGNLGEVEKLNLFNDLLSTSMGANPDQMINFASYADSLIDELDLDDDLKISVDELKAKMNELGLPDYVADEFINNTSGNMSESYDKDLDGKLDKIEFINALIGSDAYSDGVLEFNEEIAMYSAASGADLTPTKAETTRYTNLYNQAIGLFNKYDKIEDKILDADELEDYFVELNLPATMAADLVNNAAYNLNSDSGIDLYEWMNILENFDKFANGGNNNGILDADERLAMLGKFANPEIDFNITDPRQADLYNYAVSIINEKGGGDKNLSSGELKNWLGNYWGFTDDMAAKIIGHYDNTIGNGDGKLNSLEYAKALIDFDADANGKIDTTEAMRFYNTALSDGTVNYLGTIDENNAAQKHSLYQSALSYINSHAGSDKEFSATELQNWLESYWGFTDDMAAQIIEHYDVDKNGKVNVMEYAKALIDFDADANGKIDTTEAMRFYNTALSDGAVNYLGTIDENNSAQKYDLYKTALSYINSHAGSDKEFSATELQNWLKNYWGLTDDMAAQIIEHYDADKDGKVNVMEYAKALINIDADANGQINQAEAINFYDEAITTVDLSKFSDSQKTTYREYAVNFIKSRDINSDQVVDTDEYALSLSRSGFENADIMAANAISLYDKNGDGGLDTFEWMDAVLSFDSDGSGKLEGDEITAFYDSIKE